MSDLKNADGSPIAPEAQTQAEVLSLDAEIYSRNGTTQSQNTLSFSRGQEVSLGSTLPRIAPGKMNGVGPTPDSCTSDFNTVQSRPVTVQPVDRKTITGSTPGDFRAKGADAKLPGNPGPRDARGQAHLNSGLDKADNSGN
jgi:hypothetical protein